LTISRCVGGRSREGGSAFADDPFVFSNLKTWLLGTHHDGSTPAPQAYLNEYVFRFIAAFIR